MGTRRDALGEADAGHGTVRYLRGVKHEGLRQVTVDVGHEGDQVAVVFGLGPIARCHHRLAHILALREFIELFGARVEVMLDEPVEPKPTMHTAAL